MKNKLFIFLASLLVVGLGTAALSDFISNEDSVIVNIDSASNLQKACIRTHNSIACVIDVRNNLENYSSVIFENSISNINSSVSCGEFPENKIVVDGLAKLMTCEQRNESVVFYIRESLAPRTNYLYFMEIKLAEDNTLKEYIISSRIKQKEIKPIVIDPDLRPDRPIIE
jgi:predicted transcriptional regulator